MEDSVKDWFVFLYFFFFATSSYSFFFFLLMTTSYWFDNFKDYRIAHFKPSSSSSAGGTTVSFFIYGFISIFASDFTYLFFFIGFGVG